jgi:hypothetical protein
MDLFYKSINIVNVDQAQLAYLQIDDFEYFKDRTILDGSGNDIYFGHIPSKEQFYANKVSLAHYFKNFIKYQHNTNFPKGRFQKYIFLRVYQLIMVYIAGLRIQK